jgi:hypothetical protein
VAANWDTLAAGLIAPAFALISILVGAGESFYIRKQADRLCKDKGIDSALAPYFAIVAESAVVLRNLVTCIVSGLLSIVVAFKTWPESYRFFGVLIVICAFLLFFRGWFWQVLSLDLYQIVSEKVRRRKARSGSLFRSYTYAQLYRREQIAFNVALIVVIVVGWLLA